MGLRRGAEGADRRGGHRRHPRHPRLRPGDEAPFPPVVERVIRNDFTATWHDREEELVARRAEVRDQLGAAAADDTQTRKVAAGTVVGLISSVEPAGEIVRMIIAEAERVLRERPAQVLR